MSFVLVLISCNIFISAVFLRFLIKFNFLLKPIKTLFKIYSTSKEPSNKETISCVDVVLRKMIILKPTLNVVLSCRQCPRGLPPECRQHGVLLWVQEEQLLPQASSTVVLYFFYSFARILFLCSFKFVTLAQTLLVQCPWIFLSCFLSYSTVSSIIQSDLVLAFTWAFILLVTSMNWAWCVQFSETGSFKNMHVWDWKESAGSLRDLVWILIDV